MNKSVKAVAVVAVVAAIASPAAMAQFSFGNLFASVRSTSNLTITVNTGGRSAFFAAIDREDPRSPN